MNEATVTQIVADPTPNGTTAPPLAPSGYDLLDEVGRGGMGVVYRARDIALDREVAVKILQDKYAPDSGTARRFVDEARITGQLQHPGIPAVYQVGTLGDGRPFLAMKLIKGQTLDELLKSGVPVDALAITEAVGQAVGYAHAHCVIHRDLKPANIMVGAFGEVQVMDWGLAKVLTVSRDAQRSANTDPETTFAQTEIRSMRDTDGSFTQAGSVLGTPAFMAPEQALGEVDKVDTRSDVFGLGAILCVLLTGKPPFSGKDAESVRLNAIRGKTEEAFARLDASGADPDVIALCKRCLAFEPTDRPATADEVAGAVAGLRRAADDRAKQAERDKHSAEVRVEEQRKRRKMFQWSAAVVVWALVGGVVASLWQAKRAMRAEYEAASKQLHAEDAQKSESVQLQRAIEAAAGEKLAKERALAKEAEANAVVQFLVDKVFAAARPKELDGGLGKDVTLRDAILAGLPELGSRFTKQPLVEARLRETLGGTFFFLGNFKVAEEQFERSLAIFSEWSGPDHPHTLASMTNLASIYSLHARNADAVRLNEQALSIRNRVLPKDHPHTLAVMSNLAANYADLGRKSDALKLRQEVLVASRRSLPPDHPDFLSYLNNLAVSYAGMNRYSDALKLWEEILAARKRIFPPDHPDTLMGMSNLAVSYAAAGRTDDALKMWEEALAARKRVLPQDHPDTLKTMNNLAVCYRVMGRRGDALTLHEETLAAHRRTLPPIFPDRLLSLCRVAESLVGLNRGAEAIPLVDEFVSEAAGKVLDPGLIPKMMAFRLRHFQAVGDPAGCRSTAAMWEKLNRTGAGSLYDAACYRAAAAGVQAKTPGADAARLAQEDADRAMAWLTKAVAAGYKDRLHMGWDKDLDALRSRADFQKLLASLPVVREVAPPPRAAR